MLDEVWKRWAFAGGLAVVIALTITALLSRPAGQTREKRADAFAAWKAHTAVDLAALPRLHPPRPDSEAARALDAIVKPARLHLGNRSSRPPDFHGFAAGEEAAAYDLREALRAEMRFETTEVKPFPPTVVPLLEHSAPVLDAVAAHVETHDDIRWYEDFGPRARQSPLVLDDHLWLHRLLIGRAYLALHQGDADTAKRMLATSQRLNRVLSERHERLSQFNAAGIERLHLALLRRAGPDPGVGVEEPLHELRERFVTAMSAEAALVLANSSRNPFAENDPPEIAVRVIAGGSLELAASEAVAGIAKDVAAIVAATDPCAELARDRRARGGFFSGDFYTLNATEAWRRFVVLALDRAITAAALTGRASSPCASVTITVRDDGTTRTVETTGLPAPSENVISLPAKVTVPLKRVVTTSER